MTASSSSSSSAFDKLMRPSEDAERRVLGWDGTGEDVDVDEDGWMKWRAVMSSEWVEAWVRRGATGFRGSLRNKPCS